MTDNGVVELPAEDDDGCLESNGRRGREEDVRRSSLIAVNDNIYTFEMSPWKLCVKSQVRRE
jgi:hypothetical protein